MPGTVLRATTDQRGFARRIGFHRLARISVGFRVALAFAAVGMPQAAAEIGAGACRITVVEEGSDWPVPMVELRTTHGVRLVSDNAGVIAFDLPELLGRECWLTVEGHGYGVAPDGFGYRGVRLTPEAGKTVVVKVRRELPARRLGRLTGAGLFAESQRFGLAGDWRESGVLGCDSLQLARHQGKLFWLWGDTTLARHPLGLFHMSGATTGLRPLKSFEPPLRLTFDSFQNERGAVRSVAKMPGSGPTWVSGVVSLPARDGTSRLVGTYLKIKPPLEAYETGLCVWNEEEERFVKHRTLWTQSAEDPRAPLCPDGHPVFHTDQDGKDWLLFGDPFPRLKMAPTFEAWSDPESWLALEPQKTVPTRTDSQEITPHRGSIAWSPYRKKWVTIFTQKGGKPSYLGEIWYAESPHPTGPWGSAVKVVSHQNYTFYNPRLHPELTDPDSPILLFEGTFTRQFADRPHPLPRYDYNQILYRLDLDDPALTGR